MIASGGISGSIETECTLSRVPMWGKYEAKRKPLFEERNFQKRNFV